MSSIEKHTLGDFKLKIKYSPDPTSPRESMDNLGTMVFFGKYRHLGDEHDIDSNEFNGWDDNESFVTKEFDSLVTLPVYGYSHGGLTVSSSPFSCRWDSGRLGHILVSKKKVREEFGVKRISSKLKEKVIKCLEGEIETLDQYVTGEIYCFKVINTITKEVVDSCYEYYDIDQCRTDGMDSMKYHGELQSEKV